MGLQELQVHRETRDHKGRQESMGLQELKVQPVKFLNYIRSELFIFQQIQQTRIVY
jgi:hypothetical protein